MYSISCRPILIPTIACMEYMLERSNSINQIKEHLLSRGGQNNELEVGMRKLFKT